ncbi:MAG TPA: hypothetical protein VM124_03665 [Candidatus Limnocylindrales bacterium]|nr:hypothetical protein [Candidatus Limnocylindrales bacterium]
MTDVAESLPPLEGDLSRATLLRHLMLGNILGYAVFFDEGDAEAARTAQREPAGLGRLLIEACQQINDGAAPEDMELGTDFYFHTPDEEPVDLTEDMIAVLLTEDDAGYLLEHLPKEFLDEMIPEA